MSISLMVSFNFGLPRHFHLLLCNCLVLSFFVFCGKSKRVIKLQAWSVERSYYMAKRLPKEFCFCGNKAGKIGLSCLLG